MKKNILITAIIIILTIITIKIVPQIKEDISNKTSDIVDDINEDNDKTDDEKDDLEEENKHKETITIIASGDIMFHDTQLISAYNKESDKYEFDSVFKYVKKYISEADVAITNFETVTVKNEKYQGYPTFNSPIESIETLKNAGFDILSTANNHSLDKGKIGLLETIENINDLNIKNIGTYKENEEEILVEDIKGIKIAFLSYTYGVNGYKDIKENKEITSLINIIDEEKIKSDIEKANNSGADTVVVFLHWGDEYQRTPSQHQKDLSIKIFEWGGDIILGSHPHVIQKSEIVNYQGEDKFVIYSMGNFISNQRRETLTNENKNYTEDGILVKIKLEKDLSNDKVIIKNIEYIPTWVNREKVADKYKYEILPLGNILESIGKLVDDKTKDKINASYENTINIMDMKLQEVIVIDKE